jgi:hypothetical protein
MAYQPNFGAVTLSGHELRLVGEASGTERPEHMLVYVKQDSDLIARGIVESFSEQSDAVHWDATLPVEPEPDTGRPVLCFGVEIRTEPQFAAVTWSQMLPVQPG